MKENFSAYMTLNEPTLRQMVVRSLRFWGDIASDAILSPGTAIFQIQDIEGFIGYRLENQCAIALGNPVCKQKDFARLALAFNDFCKRQKYSCIYVFATGEFANWAMDNFSEVHVEFGNEVFVDPRIDPRSHKGEHASLVRRKVRHAEKEGVTVSEFLDDSEEIKQALIAINKGWIENRKGPQVYISNVLLFDDSFGKRWFYAKQGDKIVGVVVLNELRWRNGWLLNHLMFISDAPHGTPELLVVTALLALGKEEYSLVTFGNVAGDFLEIKGLGKVATWIAKNSYLAIRSLFHLQGHMDFWDKFNPQSLPSYLLFCSRSIGLKELLALRKTFNMKIL